MLRKAAAAAAAAARDLWPGRRLHATVCLSVCLCVWRRAKLSAGLVPRLRHRPRGQPAAICHLPRRATRWPRYAEWCARRALNHSRAIRVSLTLPLLSVRPLLALPASARATRLTALSTHLSHLLHLPLFLFLFSSRYHEIRLLTPILTSVFSTPLPFSPPHSSPLLSAPSSSLLSPLLPSSTSLARPLLTLCLPLSARSLPLV